MASIHGLKLKNVKTSMGREGEACQGDIYLGDEKICFWSQDGNGGMDTFDCERMYSERKLNDVIKYLYKDKPIIYYNNGKEMKMDYSIDLVMGDLIELNDLQNDYLKYRSKGFQGLLVISNMFYRKSVALSSNHCKLTNAKLLAEFYKEIKEFENSKGKDDLRIRIFRDIKDFDIDEPIKIEQLYDVRKLNDFYKWKTIVFEDKTITKEEFDLLDTQEQQKILELDFVPSKKDYYFYEKNYLLSLTKNEPSKELEMDGR